MSQHPVFAAIKAFRDKQENDIKTLAWLHAELAHQVREKPESDEVRNG